MDSLVTKIYGQLWALSALQHKNAAIYLGHNEFYTLQSSVYFINVFDGSAIQHMFAGCPVYRVNIEHHFMVVPLPKDGKEWTIHG